MVMVSRIHVITPEQEDNLIRPKERDVYNTAEYIRWLLYTIDIVV